MGKIKTILLSLWALLSIFLVTFLIVLVKLRPEPGLNILLFYISLLGLAFCFFTLVGFNVRKAFAGREFLMNHLIISSRQGLWFSVLVSVSMFLLSQKWFTWLNASFLVLALVFLEGYLLTKDHNQN